MDLIFGKGHNIYIYYVLYQNVLFNAAYAYKKDFKSKALKIKKLEFFEIFYITVFVHKSFMGEQLFSYKIKICYPSL